MPKYGMETAACLDYGKGTKFTLEKIIRYNVDTLPILKCLGIVGFPSSIAFGTLLEVAFTPPAVTFGL